MADEPDNIVLKQLALLRTDMQQGFDSLRTELASLNETVTSLARTQVTMQRDLRNLNDRVNILTAAFAGDDGPTPTHERASPLPVLRQPRGATRDAQAAVCEPVFRVQELPCHGQSPGMARGERGRRRGVLEPLHASGSAD